MKKFLVIGNPIEHSLSPKLQNYWIKSNNLNAIYVLTCSSSSGAVQSALPFLQQNPAASSEDR